MKHTLFLSLLLFSLFSGITQSITLAEFSFKTTEEQQAFRELTEELRCLVCQNESLAGSNAELAQDLRKEIYDLIQSGNDKGEVIDFMVERYGDFVLYNPPLKPSTYILWFSPLLLLLIGAVVLFKTVRSKRQTREKELSASDQERLNEILTQSSENQSNNK